MSRIISLLIFVLTFICCSDLQAGEKYFAIVESEPNLKVTFAPVTVPKGSVKEEIIPLTHVKPKDCAGVIGFIKEDKIDNYKTILPHESYATLNFHIKYEIAYKKDGGLIALIRKLENRSDVEAWDVNARTIYLNWHLLRVRNDLGFYFE